MALRVVALRGDSWANSRVVVWQFQKNLNLVLFIRKGQVLRGNSDSFYCVLVRKVGSQIISIVFMLLDKNRRAFWRLS